MPKDFNDCVKNGGKVMTVSVGKGKYRHICKDSKGSHAGHVKTKKKEA